MTVSARAAALFRNRFGGEPDGLWHAPGRVNLMGEHTDYNDGFVIPIAIDRGTTAALALRDDGRIRIASSLDIQTYGTRFDAIAARRFAGWLAYPLGIAWAFLETGVDEARGFDLALDSDVPIGAGLSSSAAVEMATATALDEAWELGADRIALAKLGQRAENIAVGAPTGVMDQVASVLGATDSAVFLDCRSLEFQHVALGLADAGLSVVVIDTRVRHSHATSGYGDRRAACDRGSEVLGVSTLRELDETDLGRAERLLDRTTFRRVRHVVTENQRVLQSVQALEGSDLAALGAMMFASHESMRDDFEISTPELDAAVEVARDFAVGARMTGGGFGGSAIALVRSGLLAEFKESLATRFAVERFSTPDVFEVVPSAGATRVAALAPHPG